MIIGITGTLGSGKGAVVSYLVNRKGFTHYSARTFLTKLMERDSIPINRNTMIEYANELRSTYGSDYVFASLFGEAEKQGGDAVIESIRTLGEADALKAHGGVLLAVDADVEKRYARIHGRGSMLDHVSFDEFKEQEAREMHSDNPHKQSIAEVMRRADMTIRNDGTLTDLYAQVERFFAHTI